MYNEPVYLLRNVRLDDGYIRYDKRSEAYAAAANTTACSSCRTHLGASGSPRVTFEHPGPWTTIPSGRAMIYLTVTCLPCASTVWARLTVAAEAGDKEAAA